MTHQQQRKLRGILLLFVVLVLPAAAAMLPPTPAQARVAVELGPTAVLAGGGEAVVVTVTVACAPPRLQALEAFVYVTQDGFTSNFAPIPVTCAGRRQVSTVRVARGPDQPPLHAGPAHASAYVLLIDPRTSATQTGSATRAIRVQ
jgi:hypothetical protein